MGEVVGATTVVAGAGAKLLAVGFKDVGKTLGIVGCFGKTGGFLDLGLGGLTNTVGDGTWVVGVGLACGGGFMARADTFLGVGRDF